MQRFYINIMAFFLFSAIQLVGRSLRFKIDGQEALAQLKGKVLFAVWHQATFAMFYLYRNKNAVILVSEETRGQILGRCAQWLGYQIITVPSQKENFDYAQSLVNMLRLMKQGCDAVIAVDGPNGPLFEIKPGVFYIAGKAEAPIVPVGVSAPWKMTLFWRWDKYFVPWPFSRVNLNLGQAVLPGAGTAAELKSQLQEQSQ